MARISTYITDQPVDAEDKWIGTESSGNATKNFTAKGVAEFLNNTSSIAGQSNFFFQTDLALGRSPGTISFTNGGGADTLFSSLTSIKISKFLSVTSPKLVLNYLETMVGFPIIISQTDDINQFGIYKLISLTQDIIELDFYNAALEALFFNGSLLFNKFYTVTHFSANGGQKEITLTTNNTSGVATLNETTGVLNIPNYTDSFFMFNQETPSVNWVLNHNLNKFPSVSVVDTAGTQVFTIANYINTNSLTLTFSAPFAGKAYLN